MAVPESLSLAQARRIALAAQGFTDPAPAGAPTRRHLRRVLDRVGLIQMDSVNVLQRAHYLPLYSRLGPYPTTLLDAAAYRRPRDLFEYWGHEASLVPVGLHAALRWRMARARTEAWGGMRRIAAEQPGLVAWVRDEVAAKGPLTAAEIEHDAPRETGNWGWNWSAVKRALEFLFWAGEVTAAGRTTSFARRYDLPERVLPAAALEEPTPTDAEAYRTLVAVAARSLGVAAEPELRDYFRLPVAGARAAVAELAEAGELLPVRVHGWRQPAWLHARARLPRRVRGNTLVSPFDPVVWERGRAERLFDFSYRIEIYVPAPQRVHGYYVLPFLQGERFTARVDLKADRKARVLRVPAAWLESGADPGETALALAAELYRLAGWLGLDAVAPPAVGDLAAPLAAALAGVSGVP
ncbi:crosslink repair DNA glycosylase YcaQ family protein [Micromonospora sp. WMMA1363]|uniref:winged helix-turn-helix domain-containing protein n=1 Tax=Micromonospora sp. WMMA1363 TaxID=3053985 RepID=UPI00259D1286|nr:crosslink repair DNA glycosylase YcaQ family protein [Micromonospora sp. WMMA1363]MDM4723120.1 crosslink repair DNA glycosylase YcaQ family protein [Micromonospora sp. WMMA1363]